MVSCYNPKGPATPHIDKLAAAGIRFDRGYTTCPVCTPARAGIFTGLYPSKAGAFTNNLAIQENRWTMGQYFTQAGYRSAYIGKWHLDGHDYFGTGECPEGYEAPYWYDGKRYLDDLSESEIHLWRQGLKSVDDFKEHDIAPEFTWAHRNADKAITFLDDWKKHSEPEQQPFCLVVSMDEPHGPFACPYEHVKQFEDFEFDGGPAMEDSLENKPSHIREWAESVKHKRPRKFKNARYFGCNHFVDQELGRVINHVNQVAPDNTWIVYTSDHGDMFGAHGITSKGPAMYEEITRVPFIIRPPREQGYPEAVSNSTPVSHIDLLPTLLEAAGLKIPPILDGRSLLSDLGKNEDKDAYAIIEFHRHSLSHDSYGGFIPIRSIVQDGYKLVINLHQSDELYDLNKDPAEMNNLINDTAHTRRRDELLSKLLSEMDRARDPFRGPCWERRSWRKERSMHWKGDYRMKPDDGFSPPPRVYATGQPETFEKSED